MPCPAASLICRLDTAYMPRSANNRSAADKIASRVPVERSLRRPLAAVTASVNTRVEVKSSSLFNCSTHGGPSPHRAPATMPPRTGRTISVPGRRPQTGVCRIHKGALHGDNFGAFNFYDDTKPHLRALILGQRDSPIRGLCARTEATEPPSGRSPGTHCGTQPKTRARLGRPLNGLTFCTFPAAHVG